MDWSYHEGDSGAQGQRLRVAFMFIHAIFFDSISSRDLTLFSGS